MKMTNVLTIALAAGVMAVTAAMGGNPELPVVLGEAAHFTILAGSAITSADPRGDIYGDAGVSPAAGSTIGLEPTQMKGGIIYATVAGGPAGSVVDPVMLTTAQGDLTTAYGDAAGRTFPDVTYAAPGELGGLTLPPGLYKFLSTAQLTSGDLTLSGSASDVWIFQIGTALTVGTYRQVILIGGARAQNVFWQVGSSADLNTYCDFKGTIMADQHIVLGVGSKLEGRALARIAHVVFDGEIARLPNVELTIVSEHGVGTPPTGAYVNAYGSLLTNSISAQETIGGTQYVARGWSMIGNDPGAGLTNAMSMIHTNDAVLTWLWNTNYMLNASAGLGGTVTGSSNGFYAAGAETDVTAVPDPGYYFVGWTGDVVGPENSESQFMTMNQARTLVALFAREGVTLAIISEHGIGTPPAGLPPAGQIYTNSHGAALMNSISAQETIGGTQYVARGWSMIGNSPLSGLESTVWMIHTNDAVLTWLWHTNYMLHTVVSPPGAGVVTGSTNGFYRRGTLVTMLAGAAPGWRFAGWLGNIYGSRANASLPQSMNQARRLTATFVLETPACGIPVTRGAYMELDLSSRFTGANLTYAATSTRPTVMPASITAQRRLRLSASAMGLTTITVTARRGTEQPQLYSFPVRVLGHPLVMSKAFSPHEPWNPRFEQKFVIKNNSGNPCPAIGLRLLFSNIKPGIIIKNQTGRAPWPDRRPIIDWKVSFPTDYIQRLSVIYLSTGAFRPDRYPPTVEVQYILPNAPPVPPQTGGVRITNVRRLPDGRYVLEFLSVAGRRYKIEYMNEAPTGIWRSVPMVIYAGGNRTQWIDYGPPATLPRSGRRIYRVRAVTP